MAIFAAHNAGPSQAVQDNKKDDQIHLDTNAKNPSVLARVLTVPTVITFARLFLVPVVFFLILNSQNLWAFALFVIAAVTDFLDGYIARKTNTVTEFGKAIDPLVDRLLLACGVIALHLVFKLPLWMLIFVLARDLVLLTGFSIVRRIRVAEVKIRFVGKMTTTFLLAGFAILILGVGHSPQGLGWTHSSAFPGFSSGPYYFGIWFIYLGLLFSAITFFTYLYDGIKLIRTTEPRQDATA